MEEKRPSPFIPFVAELGACLFSQPIVLVVPLPTGTDFSNHQVNKGEPACSSLGIVIFFVLSEKIFFLEGGFYKVLV